MALHSEFNWELNQVLIEGDSFVKKVVLNRPTKLNSLNYEMISQISKNLKALESDPETALVILKGNGKAFCAGGDVISTVSSMAIVKNWSFGARFYWKQLNLDYLIGTYKKPLISLIDGIVMGGGAGLSMHGKFRIVTENAVFAMPEASLGHFPDVGSSHFLSRLSGHFGEYLGLIGARLTGPEMLACGLATHFVLSKDLPLLENALETLDSSETITLYEILSNFSQKPGTKEDSPYKRLEIINKCFSKDTVEEILLSLEQEMKNEARKWIIVAFDSIKSASPTSLKIALRSIREGRVQNLKQCLIREYTTCCNVFRATINYDLYEGSRAMLIDKDKRPKWEPSKLELVGDNMVDRCFNGIDEDDCEYLHLPDRHSPADEMKSKL